MANCKYQVFLCFRGPDTRDSLIEYLYDQLRRLGIVAFLDREETEYGERIGTKIVDAIQRSDICVPVFSPDFASSPACLMEVAQMGELKKKILPIFFFVEPCEVRHQLGTYEKSFAEHKRKNRYPESTIKEWEDALKMIADKRGPEFKKAALESAPGEIRSTNGRFYKDLFRGFQELEVFIFELWKLLRMDEQDVTDNLVGIEKDVPEMMGKIGFDYQDGQIVKEQEMTATGRWALVVWGVAGVGKTTLAKVVYNEIRHLFEGCTFLENVRDEFEQKREISLQKKLIRDLKRGVCPEVGSSAEGTTLIKHLFREKKVLIVLDDVDDFEQIIPLAKDLIWFGPGSRIILTTRKSHIITDYKVPEKSDHEVLSMNEKSCS